MKDELLNSISYSKKVKIITAAKTGSIVLASLAGAALITFGILFCVNLKKNSTGRGGLETPKPEISAKNFDPSEQEILTLAEDSFTAPEEYVQNLNQSLSYTTYRIKKGDMIGVIAEKFGVTQDTIISVNNIRSSRLIQIGQYIKIPTMPGILYTVRNNGETADSIAKKYKVDLTKVTMVNKVEPTQGLKAGQTLFVPDAELDWVTRQEINGDLFKRPLRNRYYFSSMYGWRQSPFDGSRRTFHSGIDMACAAGSNIYAALDGTVTFTGWSDVFGNYVIVTHHSGYKTLYAHMSKILCVKGQHVSPQSRPIGLVGSTGMSTGPHLHFTVYKNGRTVNPANLWK